MATILDLAQKTVRGELPPPIGRLRGFVECDAKDGEYLHEAAGVSSGAVASCLWKVTRKART